MPAPQPAEAPAGAEDPLSHNLLGQRLGRKGRGTRERIVTATERLLAASGDPPSLSAVAREASLGMSTLYIYFKDLSELLLAVLAPVSAETEESHIGLLRQRWPDEQLGERCLAFVSGFYDYWRRHGRILHLRNGMADGGDRRMADHRIGASSPMIELVGRQIDLGDAALDEDARTTAFVLVTGVERVITVATHPKLIGRRSSGGLIAAQARIMELAVADGRARWRAGHG